MKNTDFPKNIYIAKVKLGQMCHGYMETTLYFDMPFCKLQNQW